MGLSVWLMRMVLCFPLEMPLKNSLPFLSFGLILDLFCLCGLELGLATYVRNIYLAPWHQSVPAFPAKRSQEQPGNV